MEWIKIGHEYTLKRYPFFDIDITNHDNTLQECRHSRLCLEKKLKDSTRIVAWYLYKICKVVSRSDLPFDAIASLPYIRLYFSNEDDYKIVGGNNHIYLKYDSSKTDNEVKAHACTIIKRHANRFIKEFEDLYKPLYK